MKATAKLINISTEGFPILLVHELAARQEDLHSGDRVVVTGGSGSVIASINLTTDDTIRKDQVGLFKETWQAMNAKEGDAVQIVAAAKAESISIIKKKITGERLSADQILSVVKDIVGRNLTDVELTYFVAACSINELNFDEVVALTRSVADTGTKLHFNKQMVIDKHCIGGVPGNRTSLITVPIMAARGHTIPKTSSRAITSPAGTADTMEVFTNVTLTIDQMQRVVENVGACLVWGGSFNLAPADDRIIRIERPLSIDVTGLMLSSVMAKKYSVGSTHVLIDIPCGPGAKVTTMERAEDLKRQFITLGEKLGMKLLVLITDGKEPIGYGVGPLLEAYDVLAVLRNDETAPQDLHDKAVMIAGGMLEFIGDAPKGKGVMIAEEELRSGRALKKFEEIVEAQGRRFLPALGRYQKSITSDHSGTVREIHNTRVSRIARFAGAPVSKTAGMVLYAKVGTVINAGDTLFTIYADSEEKLRQAEEFSRENSPFVISES